MSSGPSASGRRMRWLLLLTVLAAPLPSALPRARAQAPATPPAPYLNPDLDAEARARDLVSRMTVEEKISQLTNQAAAIPRLGVPAYEWWNEALHGVARAGVATVFPQAIGLAATFNVPLLHETAVVISNEGRAKHHQFVRQGKRGRYQGLTFWSPNINIFRDPAMGPRPGDLRRGPVPHGPARRRVREGAAGRRPALLPGERLTPSTSRSTAARSRTATTSTPARASATCTRPTCRRSATSWSRARSSR